MLPSGVRVYLACGVTDMRKGFDGLAALVQTALSLDPYGGALFADSVDRDQPFRPIVITCSGDRDHAVHPAGGGPGGRHDARQVAATDG
jgi:hypothetical protein